MWNRSKNQIDLVMIRHGAAESNRERRYLGKTDEALASEGISRLLEAKNTGYYPEVGCVFSSPMKRCVETAKILYPEKKPVMIQEWEEIDFGIFEGKNYRDLQNDLQYQNWIDSGGTLPFPEGESRETFVHRCRIGMYKMVDLLSQFSKNMMCEDEPVGIIVHGGTIMSILSSYGGGSYFEYQVSNGEGYRCKLQYEIRDMAEHHNKIFKITDIQKL
ncbi:MAG: histidine phosphatase family protein [Lachnospiraceae bacterium]|nr:histidine phosphatase family protein [Lachnospiraceae bacterium]